MPPTFQRHLQCRFSWRTMILCLVFHLLFLFLSSASAAVINLAWNLSADASGYKVHYGKTSRAYTHSIDVGNTDSYPLDLPMGKWYIAVTAYDANNNESDFSDEVSWPIQVFSPAPEEVIYSGSSYQFHGMRRRPCSDSILIIQRMGGDMEIDK